jgi:hypothetical protein
MWPELTLKLSSWCQPRAIIYANDSTEGNSAEIIVHSSAVVNFKCISSRGVVHAY